MPTPLTLLAALALTPILATQPADQAADQPDNLAEIKITHNYSQDLNAEALATPEAERAWPLYRDAFIEMEPMPEELIQLLLETEPDKAVLQLASEYLARNQLALQLTREASHKPIMGYILDDAPDPVLEEHKAKIDTREPDVRQPSENPWLINTLLEHLGVCRKLARLLLLDAQIAVSRGDPSVVVSDFETLLDLARHIDEGFALASDLRAMDVANVSQQLVRIALHAGVLEDAELLARLRLAFERADEGLWHLKLKQERVFFLDMVQRMYTDDGRGDGFFSATGFEVMDALANGKDLPREDPSDQTKKVAAVMAQAMTMATRREVIDEYDKLFAIAQEELETQLWNLQVSRSEQELQERADDPVWRDRHWVIGVMLPNLGAAARGPEFLRQNWDASLATIALETYRVEHDEYPMTLQDLIPKYLDALPLDRFDGNPLRYKLTDGQPLLYSIGTDRDDDGGRHVDNASEWFTPDEAQSARRGDPHAAPVPDGDWILYPPQP